MTVLKKGCHATYESADGNIPVRVTRITGESGPAGRQVVFMKVLDTVMSPAKTFFAGEEMTACALWVRPNGAGKDWSVQK